MLSLKELGVILKVFHHLMLNVQPSFMVSPEKQIWHDFSSGKGGNMFSFVMEMEGVDFRGAMEILARKAGVDLSLYQKGDGQARQKKDKAKEALELATKYYQQSLLKNKECA